jgi:flagellar protein FlgJ
MNISALNNSSNTPIAAQQDQKLSEACKQFEGLLLGMILKDSLASPQESESDGAGSGLMKQFASEQLAQSMSNDGGIGLADMLYERMINGGKPKQ